MTLIEDLAHIIAQVEQAREDAYDLGVRRTFDKLNEAFGPLTSAFHAAQQHDYLS